MRILFFNDFKLNKLILIKKMSRQPTVNKSDKDSALGSYEDMNDSSYNKITSQHYNSDAPVEVGDTLTLLHQ